MSVIVRKSIKVHRVKIPEAYVPKYLSSDDNIMQIRKYKKKWYDIIQPF